MSSVVIVLLFVGSGAAALIYEVVWQQLLQLVIGSSTVSLGVLLGVYMGGMCLGSLLAPRLVGRRADPLRIYAALEAVIGFMGLAILWGMPAITRLYLAIGGWGVGGVVVRAAVCAVCLLPPTFAMGATLPVVARWVRRIADGRALLGLFYAGNLAGAVAGCLAAGFFLLRVYDMAVTTYVAVALNAVVALLAWTWAGSSRSARVGEPHVVAEAADAAPPTVPASRAGLSGIYAAIALSGFSALAAEVVWTRLLALAFGATVYTFAIILAVFLAGLGIGSSTAALLGRRLRRSRAALGWIQLATIAAIAWSAYVLSDQLPYWPSRAVTGADVWLVFASDLGRALYAILPAPILWGASFAFALAAAGDADDDASETVGRVYAANTVGAIAGALLASLVLVRWVGSQHTQQVMQLAVLAAGLLLLWPGSSRAARGAVAATAAVAAVLVLAVPPVPALLVAYGRHSAAWARHPNEVIYVGEGMHASVAVSRTETGTLNYHNAGKIQASSEPADMRLQRMLGHLTTLIPEHPRRVLVIGCGAGVTAGAVSVNPAVEQVTIVDIEPLVPTVARQYFGSVNHQVLENPKVRVIADDARHYLQTTNETFDAITSDPLDPWVKGAATLYTREFFETARRHLNPGGVMTLYVQLFESSPDAVKSEVATFFEAFPEGLVFGNTFEGHAIDSVLVGPVQRPGIWLDEIETMLRSPAYAAVDSSLVQAGLYGAADLFGNYAGRARDLKGWLADAQVNHDLDLRLQYLAGLGLNLHAGDEIYREMLAYRTYPDDLFVGSESTISQLKAAMDGVRE